MPFFSGGCLAPSLHPAPGPGAHGHHVLDYLVYESHDLEDRDQVTWWLFRMMDVCMNIIEQNWKPELEVVVVAPPRWAVSRSAVELAEREIVNHITVTHSGRVGHV